VSRSKQVFVSVPLIFLASVVPGLAVADIDRSHPSDSEIAARITDYMQAVNKLGPFSGVVFAAKEGKVIALNSYGMANYELQVPNATQTRFRIASVTKPITAAAVMLLADDGKLSVEDPIAEYLTNCPAAWKAITIHQLLRHTSGLSDFFDLAGYDERKRAFSGREDFIEKLGKRPLQSPPGKEHRYANSNYIMLGYVIEAASGKSYQTFLRERIFGPLHMDNSGCDYGTVVIRNRAAGYSWNKEIVPADFFEMQNPFAAGCVYSTAEDLFKFVTALAGGKLVKKSTLASMLTAGDSNYGYGWSVANWNGRRVIMHGGSLNGFKSDLRYLPDDDLCVVVLSNIDVTRAAQIAEVLTRLALGGNYDQAAADSPIDPVGKLQEVKGDAGVAEACVGVYVLPMGEFIVTREGSKLFLKTPEDPNKAELQRESDMTFFIRGPAGVQLAFKRNGDGKVDEMKLTVRGREFRGKRKLR
jgi:CubicO group peptidase (beta-lactamase class C family)